MKRKTVQKAGAVSAAVMMMFSAGAAALPSVTEGLTVCAVSASDFDYTVNADGTLKRQALQNGQKHRITAQIISLCSSLLLRSFMISASLSVTERERPKARPCS